jgi:hypothetical protein
MKIQLGLIALLWSMHVSIYAADGVTSVDNNQENVGVGSNVVSSKRESVVLEEQGAHSQSNAAAENLNRSRTVHPAFDRKRDAQTNDRQPFTGKLDPGFGSTRTASGTLFESESSSDEGS